MGHAPGPYHANETVRFPVVLTNIGDGYNATDHKFTCPINGLYMFSTSLLSGGGMLAAASIRVDGTHKVSTHADGQYGPTYDHSTNVLMTECNAGQRVWIQIISHEEYSDLDDNGWNYGTFSGALLDVL